MIPVSLRSRKAKIRLIHLLTEVDSPREQASIQSLKPLEKEGVEYIQMVNPRYTGKTPRENCFSLDEKISDELDWAVVVGKEKVGIGPGTWGCFQAHKKAVTEGYSENLDYLLVCECDCLLTVAPKKFVESIIRWGRTMVTRGTWAVFIGGYSGTQGVFVDDFFFGWQSVDAHCVLYPIKTLPNIIRLFETEKWWPFDLWLSRLLGNKLCVTKSKFALQIAGKSLVDGEMKGEELGRRSLQESKKL
jgi:hypothetical protein